MTEFLNPARISDWKDQQLQTKQGWLTFRLYADGWLVRFTPYNATGPADIIKIESADAGQACAFANYHLGQ